LNYKPQESEFFDEAWENAVQDELVTDGSCHNYNFELMARMP
jgi:hypothetical protein